MFSLLQNTHLDQSLQMAAFVQEELGTYPITVNRGVKQDLFLVLWRTAMPSILIEMGFISNPEDEKVLTSKAGQLQIAKSIFLAFKRYKAYYDRQTELASNTVPVKTSATEKPAAASSGTTQNATAAQSTAAAPKSEVSTYRVQISASKTKQSTNSKDFSSFKDIRVIHSGSLYRYTAGNFNTLEEAQKYCTEVVRKKIKDAFVVRVENEKIVPLKK
jgi:N-acetylmuramoyl-L-alanine amidase